MKVNNEEDKYLFIDKVSLAKDNLMKKKNTEFIS